MNAGTPPEPGTSRMTISTYRLTRDGRRSGGTEERTYHGVGGPGWLPDSLTWPPCRCPRCGTREPP
ncbi:hypothetical protein [Streptomyces alfalfae]|uniref:hypothetical protein n=1 Tax=Streptomyces alfalfae TaxID=1642299 RepID=UPI002810BEDB|nr:hypothetical protein [Streptomyces alfalfae]